MKYPPGFYEFWCGHKIIEGEILASDPGWIKSMFGTYKATSVYCRKIDSIVRHEEIDWIDTFNLLRIRVHERIDLIFQGIDPDYKPDIKWRGGRGLSLLDQPS